MQPVNRKEHSPRPLTANALPIGPRASTAGRLQTGLKLVELRTRIRPALYIAGSRLATFPAPTVTGMNIFADIQPRTPLRLSYSPLPVPDWGATIFSSSEISIPTRPCPDASDGTGEGLADGNLGDSAPGAGMFTPKGSLCTTVGAMTISSSSNATSSY